MKKKIISLMAAAVMALAAVCGGACAEEAGGDAARCEIEERVLPVYFGNMDVWYEMPFYFMDGAGDLPWVELESWCGFMNALYHACNDEGYELTCVEEDGRIILQRENRFRMIVDFSEGMIVFDDYNMFLHNSTDSSLLDVLAQSGFNESGEASLFERVAKGTYDRMGDVVSLPLREYGIGLVYQDGRGYVPFQTLGDFLISPYLGMNTFCNGKAVFIANRIFFGGEEEGLTPLGEYYYSAGPCLKSEALAEYGYNELCLVLDCLYGLKESHGITSFSQMFWQIGFEKYLRSTDPAESDFALDTFIDIYLDDLHSSFTGYSWMTGSAAREEAVGAANNAYTENYARYERAREAALGDNPQMYMEVGNTAYITFDSFVNNASGESYYDSILNQGVFPSDTIGLIIYAHSQIYRADSPIQNVVIDLSLNSGGSVDAALFVMSWVLGNAPFCVKDTYTGALSTVLYRGDANLNRVFDAGDEVDDKDIFVLISPLSFSCGNLVPAAFKNYQKATLIGRTSGGGSCVVQPLSTAWGTMFQISGPARMSFSKNGSFYDIDQGIEPDIYLSRISSFYDREGLTAMINELK